MTIFLCDLVMLSDETLLVLGEVFKHDMFQCEYDFEIVSSDNLSICVECKIGERFTWLSDWWYRSESGVISSRELILSW